MKVIVVGCGRLGSELAYRLYQLGHDVAVIDNYPAAFHSLPGDFKGRLHEGDAMTQDVLQRAGIQSANALAAVTNSDALNMIVGHIARTIYHVPRVVARNYDPGLCELFESFSLQVISSTTWGAKRLEEMIIHPEIHLVYSAGNGEVEIYEFSIPEIWDGRRISELVSGNDCVVTSLTRVGRAFLPEEETLLLTGDIVQISATFEGVEQVRTHLSG